MKFRILRRGNRAKSKITMLDFRRMDFGLFSDLLGRILSKKALEERGAQPGLYSRIASSKFKSSDKEGLF